MLVYVEYRVACHSTRFTTIKEAEEFAERIREEVIRIHPTIEFFTDVDVELTDYAGTEGET